MAKKITQSQILEAYRAAQQLGKTEFAHELGMSKQSYSQYVHNKSQPDLEGLQEAALENVGSWIGNLAVDLLVVRGAVVPCVCQTEIGDNGPCPKHSPIPAFLKQEKKAVA
jgi:transcriptional regulator with XRE-family HTH domain